jgi:dodecin
MPIAKIIEVSAVSDKGFDDAVRSAYREVSRTVRGVQSVYVEDFLYEPGEGDAGSFRVHCKVTFVVESPQDME